MIKAAKPNESNLVRMLAVSATWCRCPSCGELFLFVDEHGETSGDLACGRCRHRAATTLAANDNGDLAGCCE
jgi:hypothetical protein